jgi:hypothetical protein
MGMKLSWHEVAEFRRKPRTRPPGPLSPNGLLACAVAFNLVGWAVCLLALRSCG